MYALETLNQLFKIVSRDRLLQSTGLREDHKKVGVIGGKNEVCIQGVFEHDRAIFEAFYYIWVLHYIKDLLLVLRLVNF